LAAVVLVLQLRALPSLPATRVVRWRDLLSPLLEHRPRMVLAVALLLVSGHFAAYTYIAPVLQQLYGLTPDAVTTLLLVYGVAGFAGTFVAGQLVARSVRMTALAAAATIGVALLFSALAGHGMVAAIVVVLAWGVAFGFVPVAMTTWMQQAAPHAPEAGQALLVTFFQTAIAAGALIGGLLVDAWGVSGTLLLGGVLAALAVVAVLFGKD
jgi:predicted MFS family arabinose efflux permease